MIWEGYWWGTIVKSENEDDNVILDKMLINLNPDPYESYEGGELKVEKENGLIKVTFER